MTGNTHVICGVSLGIFIALTHPTITLFSQEIPAFPAVITTIPGSLLPDIDIPQSKLGSKAKWLSKHLKHRGITHTLLVPAIITTGLYFSAYPLLSVILFGLLTGYAAHIFADMFNRKGVPLLFPLTNAHLHAASFKTRSWHEILFVILWIGGLAVCYILLQKNKL
jgi:inner membrane protein